LVTALIDSSKEINDWFDTSDNKTLIKAEQMLKDRVEALEEARRDIQDFDINQTKWKAPNFFEIESLGGKDNIILNSQHLFVQKLGELEEDSETETLSMLSKLLISYGKAKDILDDSEEYTARELFKYLEAEWGQILSNYVSADKE